MSGELASERWSPVQGVESVLISILSLLDDAEVSSPANVDASVMLRSNLEQYKARVKSDLEASKSDIPPGFVMPTHESAFKTRRDDDVYMSWEDSDAEDDFAGSDSDFEQGDWDADADDGDDSPSDREDTEDGAHEGV